MQKLMRKISKRVQWVGLECFAPMAVRWNFPWPEAYRFVGYKYLDQYKQLRLDSRGNLDQIREVQRKTVEYLEKYISFVPKLGAVSVWVDANFRLSSMLIGIPEADSMHKASLVGRRVGEFLRNLSATYGIMQPKIAFIPRPLAVGSLGVYENLEGYLKAMALGLVPEQKLYLVVEPGSQVNNACYLDYWSQYITVVKDPREIDALRAQEEYSTVPMLGLFKQYAGRSLLMHIGQGVVREQWLQEGRPPLLVLSEEHARRGWDNLVSLGVPRGAWFVGLHVREPGWRDKGSKIENARNANIQTYYAAIKAITDAGGWVVRMGDALSMTPLPSMERVIDYPHTNLKSDWMDMFLASQCRFLIGTGSGVYTVAMAFGVPCVMTNVMSPHNILCMTSQDLVLTKLCKSPKENRFLDFRELMAPPVGVAVHAYQDMDLELIDNTPDEIKGAVVEMLGRLDGTLKYSPEDQALQAAFKDVVKSCAVAYGDKDIECYARMARDFLRNHEALLPAERVSCVK